MPMAAMAASVCGGGREELDEVLPKLCDSHWMASFTYQRTMTTDWRAKCEGLRGYAVLQGSQRPT